MVWVMEVVRLMVNRRFARIVALSLLSTVLPGRAASQDKPPPANVSAETKAESRRLFAKGIEHFKNKDYREAIKEFEKSLAVRKTAGAMVMVASCLNELQQYEDALDWYEKALRDPNASDKIKEKASSEVTRLQEKVGTLSVAGDAPAGGSLFVNGLPRGTLPLAAPLRVQAGTYRIEVKKPPFETIEGTVEVIARRDNVANLVAANKKGRLAVTEKHNWALKVEVDGQNVGLTPWVGFVDPGEHTVQLSGFVGVDVVMECTAPDPDMSSASSLWDAKDLVKMSSRLETATIKPFEEESVALSAVEQDAALRVDSAPRGATLVIDRNIVGVTPWVGRLTLGEHAIEVSKDGFLPAKRRVVLERRKQPELMMLLERVPEPAGFWDAQTIGAGAAYGVGLLGLGVWAVSGALASGEFNALRKRCGGTTCPMSEQGALDYARVLGTISTVGLVVGSAGAVAGTIVFFSANPEKGRPRAGASGMAWTAAVGAGRFEVRGRF
jgi:hypothetical protein